MPNHHWESFFQKWIKTFFSPKLTILNVFRKIQMILDIENRLWESIFPLFDSSGAIHKIQQFSSSIMIFGKKSISVSLPWKLDNQWFHNTMAAFGNILSKKYFRQISILGTNKYKIWKKNVTFVSSPLKVMYWVPLFFQIFYLLVPKIEICLKYLLDKFFKSSHCDCIANCAVI